MKLMVWLMFTLVMCNVNFYKFYKNCEKRRFLAIFGGPGWGPGKGPFLGSGGHFRGFPRR